MWTERLESCVYFRLLFLYLNSSAKEKRPPMTTRADSRKKFIVLNLQAAERDNDPPSIEEKRTLTTSKLRYSTIDFSFQEKNGR